MLLLRGIVCTFCSSINVFTLAAENNPIIATEHINPCLGNNPLESFGVNLDPVIEQKQDASVGDGRPCCVPKLEREEPEDTIAIVPRDVATRLS